MKPARYLIPFSVAAILFCGMLALLVRHGLHADGGVFVYPLDDAYIHLAVSRNLALHGVWGISRYGFSGASSSPAWTLLLAAIIRVAGVHVMTPLILNGLAALALLLLTAAVLARALPRAGIAFLCASLCALVLVTPLPGLALIGMEHMLHSLAMLALVTVASWIAGLPKSQTVPGWTIAILLITSFACGALRYESCFGIAVIGCVLLLRGRVLPAFVAAVGAAIGPLAYGVFSHQHSGLWLPFSVLMKSSGHGNHPSLDSLFASSLTPLLVLLTVAFFLRMAQHPGNPGRTWSFAQSFLVIALLTTLLHAMVGPTGWLMRYESYLYVLGMIALALTVGEALASHPSNEERTSSPAEPWIALAIAVAILPAGLELVHRAHHGWSDILASTHDRYVEHLPQALFVNQEMPQAAVIANDIGFLAFYAPDAKILDPLGLGSIEPVRLQRKRKSISPAFVEQWGAKENAQLAILHTDFPGIDTMIPTGWILVESWCFPHNLVFQNHVESFYAPGSASAETLRVKLASFQQLSPEIVRYRFPQNGQAAPAPPRGETAVCPVPAS